MSSKIAKDIFEHALKAVLPQNFMKKECTLKGNILSIATVEYDLSSYKNIYVFGSGKAALGMAKETEEILDSRIYKGLVVAPNMSEELEIIEVHQGSHPLPSKKSLSATQALIQMMQECDKDDLYIYLLSGGSSALIEMPSEPITIEEFQKATDLMLSNALEIQEINTVRKHISQIKGGRLAQMCKATGVVLVISDVIGDDLFSIGSAPLYADNSTFHEAKEILQRKNIYSKFPKSIQDVLDAGIKGEIQESPFESLKRVSHYIIASNTHAKNAAAEYAKSLGLSVKLIEESFSGEVSHVVGSVLEMLQDTQEQCLILGGECTVNVRGNGQGGRNQHATLLALREMKKKNLNITFLSCSTDGIDGNSNTAGAVVDFRMLEKVDLKKLEKYLKNYDSYHYLKQLGALVITGPTQTNVIDLIIIIKGDIHV